MIADTNAWLGGAFWRDRDVMFSHFQQDRARKKAKPQAAFTMWLWPGAGDGVRPPMQDETALSMEEVAYLESKVSFL